MLLQRSSFENGCEDGGGTPGNSNNLQNSSYPCYSAPYQYPRNYHENLVYVIPSDSNEPTSNSGSGNVTNGVGTNEPVTKNAGSRWREDETEALVEIWRDKICQTRWWKQSKGVRVNKEMWEEIASLLAEREVFRTPAQCQIRMKNLLQFYRQTIDSRRSEKSWEDLPEYFDIVDKIMTRKDATGTPSSIAGSGSSNISDVPNLQDMSPPSTKYHSTEKTMTMFDDPANKDHLVDNAGTEERKTTKKRKLSAASDDEYNGHTEAEHNNKQFYPSPNSSSVNHRQLPPRKLQSCAAVKSEYSPIQGLYPKHQIRSPYTPSNAQHRIHREQPCNGNCCSSKPSITFSRKIKEKELTKENHPSEFPHQIPSVHPPVEHYGMMSGSSHIMSLPNETTAKENKQQKHPAACNYYTTGPGDHQTHPNFQPPQPPPQQPQNHRHNNYIQLYRGGNTREAVHNKPMQQASSPHQLPQTTSHMIFNQDLLQLQYKQMKTLIEIEKRRLEIEESRMKEEKEANSRTSAYLLEAVKILAETFRKDNNNNNTASKFAETNTAKEVDDGLSPSITMTLLNSIDDRDE